MSQEDPYFNAGVLLQNLKKCRQDNVMSNAIKFMVEYPDKILFGEQDGLNFAMSNNFLNMPPRWNVQSFMFNIFYSGDLRRKHSPEIVEAVKNPAIVHFTCCNSCNALCERVVSYCVCYVAGVITLFLPPARKLSTVVAIIFPPLSLEIKTPSFLPFL